MVVAKLSGKVALVAGASLGIGVGRRDHDFPHAYDVPTASDRLSDGDQFETKVIAAAFVRAVTKPQHVNVNSRTITPSGAGLTGRPVESSASGSRIFVRSKGFAILRSVACLLSALALGGSGRPAVQYSDYARDFDRFEAQTRGLSPDERVAEFRAHFEQVRPGLYSSSDPQRLNRRIARSLEAFTAIRPAYRSVERRFGQALAAAITHFRHLFPGFSPPLPIILAHELGVRDGGTDYVAGEKVMLFGADRIAELHNDDSLQPFLEHELFHLEHARHFADCDQFWCLLWQEGLATYAASVMTPHATDHQLLLDQPQPIREPTERHWREALCFADAQLQSSDEKTIALAFTGGEIASPSLPRRFGYYVGYRVAAQAARTRSLGDLALLDNKRAKSVVVEAMRELLTHSGISCAQSADS